MLLEGIEEMSLKHVNVSVVAFLLKACMLVIHVDMFSFHLITSRN